MTKVFAYVEVDNQSQQAKRLQRSWEKLNILYNFVTSANFGKLKTNLFTLRIWQVASQLRELNWGFQSYGLVECGQHLNHSAFESNTKPRRIWDALSLKPELNRCLQGRCQRGGAVVPGTPIWNLFPPISRLAPWLLHISKTVFLKCGPLFWFLAPLFVLCPPDAKSWRRLWLSCVVTSLCHPNGGLILCFKKFVESFAKIK